MMRLVHVSPIAVGARVRVERAVALPSGRAVRKGTYVADEVRGRAVVVTARPCCKALPKRFQERDSIAREARQFVLEPGQYTAYADGESPATIPDHPALAAGQ